MSVSDAGQVTLPRLHHVSLAIPLNKIDPCHRFYKEILGLHQIESPIAFAIWFEEGIHLYWGEPKNQQLNGEPPLSHFALAVGKEYSRIVRECQETNRYLGTGSEYWGSPRCFVQDPAFNRIEIMEFAP